MKLAQRLASLRPCFPKMVADVVLFALAYVLAFTARLGLIEAPYATTLLLTLPFVVIMKIAIFHFVGSYRCIWKYSSLQDLEALMFGIILAGGAMMAMAFLLPPSVPLPRAIPLIDMALTMVFAGAARMLVRTLNESSTVLRKGHRLRMRLRGAYRSTYRMRRTLIVGAGDAGEMIVREMMRSPMMDYVPVAFVDDDTSKQGQSIHGLPVLGGRSDIPRLVEELTISDILITIPTARGKAIREIVEVCRNTEADLKTLPDVSRLVDGRVQLSDLRNVQVEDLLSREPAELNVNLVSAYLRGKRILITGAGGSIGSELCRQILRFGPTEIVAFGRGEHSIYEIHRELHRSSRFTRLVQVIGDVINKKKLEGVFAMYRPQIVFHAGADKHVPLMELNPDEAVLNNIVGTKNLLEVSNANGVERVVCISTDKAVEPSNVMGCCKRVAELLVCSKMYPGTVPVAVRFGNVLGSRGSVIPHFQRQIEDGGPVTVTNKDMTRYFMTIPEAVKLVIHAGAIGTGGEIFVLDMGDPVKIWDLAVNMIRLAGLEPGREIEIEEIGLRPGEKMEEHLFGRDETPEPTSHPKINCVRNGAVESQWLLDEIASLTQKALNMDYEGIRHGLTRLVPEYRSAPESGEESPSADDRASRLDDLALSEGGSRG
jgi:FlaA1/EpsC-like NDP-sugar epimerase